MTPIVQLRKEQRVVSSPEGQTTRTSQMPSTHISPFVQKILGLKSSS
jgi:hypothetical protein